MRKGDDGETGKMGEKGKIMMKIVATNVVASRPPERGPTATPTAHDKSFLDKCHLNSFGSVISIKIHQMVLGQMLPRQMCGTTPPTHLASRIYV